MRRRPIHLLPLAYGARRSPLIYPANRTRSDGRPRRIRGYKMCSIHHGLWCWDATAQAASDDAPSQPRGWRGVLSFSFEVRMRQGRVTLPCKSLRGVRPPNNEDQCVFFVALMALKYPVLEMFAISLRAMVPCLRASRAAM